MFIQARQEAGGLITSPSSTKTADASTAEEPEQQGWGTAFEKFITAITDPDAEEKVTYNSVALSFLPRPQVQDSNSCHTSEDP